MSVAAGPLRPVASRAAGWALVEILSRQGVYLLATLVLARLLAPESFALFALVLIFSSVGALLAESGFTSALVQRGGGCAGEQATALAHGLAVGLLCPIAIWLLAPAISRWLSTPELEPMLRFSALAVPAVGLAVVPDALLTSRLDFKARAWAEGVAAIVASAAGIATTLSGGEAWGLVVLLVVGPVVRCLLVWVRAGWLPRAQPTLHQWRSLFRFGANVMVASMLDTLVLRLQSLLLARMGDMRGLGHYTLAQNVQLAPATLIAQLLYRIGLPIFTRMTGDQARIRSALDRMNRVATFLIAPPMVVLSVLSSTLMESAFGIQWRDAGPMLAVLSIATVFWPISALNLTLLNALGRSDLYLRVEVAKKLVLVTCLVAGLPWGGIGLAWAVLAGAAIGTCLNMIVVGRLTGHGLSAQFRALSPTLYALGIAFGGALALRAAGLGEWATVAAYLGIHVVMVAIVDREALRELRLVEGDLRARTRGSRAGGIK